jgi:serine protease Do
MPLGTTRDLEVGETVVAIGNAYGYDHTVTVGVVSAVGRDVTLNREVRYRSLIQTDASINPGNSGGPLINLHGELIGVNVAIRAGAQGIGFAIPVDTMIKVASSMLGDLRTRTSGASVGLTTRDEVPTTAISRRVLIDRVEDGPASKAGLRKGDLVLKVGETVVASSLDVQRGLLDRQGSQCVEMVIRRDGTDRKLEISLDSAPQAPVSPRSTGTVAGRPASATGSSSRLWTTLGIRVHPLGDPAEITRTHPQLHGGLVVSDIRPESPASRAGFRIGDILVGLHQWEMLNVDNVVFVLNHPDLQNFSPLRFYILRAGQVHRGALHLSE